MNHPDIIQISQKIRSLKDQEKKNLKNGIISNPNIASEGIKVVLPKYLFENELDLRADMDYFNGFLIDVVGDLIVVDPSTDFYARMLASGYSPLQIRALIVTHHHMDHLDGLRIFLEKFYRYGSNKIDLFLPYEAHQTEISEYHRNKMASKEYINLVLLDADNGQHQTSTILGKYQIEFLEMFHGCIDTFGFKIKFPEFELGHITDTGYAIEVETSQGIFPSKEAEGDFIKITQKHEYIKEFYKDSDYVVVNINDISYNRHSKYHLSGHDVVDIFQDSKLKKLILQHILPINIEEEDSNYLYKLFFYGQPYETMIPHYLKRVIKL